MPNLLTRDKAIVGALESLGDATITGAATVAGAFTPALGVTPVVESRTATADGTTTGVISAGTDHVTVTSANSAYIVTLPAPVVGKKLVVDVGANGCRIASSTPASIGINGGTGASANSTIAANSTCFLFCVSATSWKGFFMDADSDLAKIAAAA